MGFWDGKSEYEEGLEEGREAKDRAEEHPIAGSLYNVLEELVVDIIGSDQNRKGYHEGSDEK